MNRRAFMKSGAALTTGALIAERLVNVRPADDAGTAVPHTEMVIALPDVTVDPRQPAFQQFLRELLEQRRLSMKGGFFAP